MDLTRAMNYSSDALNSTIALSDPNRSTSEQYTYEPFGRSTTSTSDDANAYRYTGRELDSEGYYYYRARYYDPQASRFISADAFGVGSELNLYEYALNDPVRYTDPTGLDVWLTLDAAATGHLWLLGESAIAGLILNLKTREVCLFTAMCGRLGFGFLGAVGGRIGGSILGPHCGKDMGGFQTQLVLDAAFGTEGAGVGIGGGSSGVAGNRGIGPEVGGGVSAGIEVCNSTVRKCWNTPIECRGCNKK